MGENSILRRVARGILGVPSRSDVHASVSRRSSLAIRVLAGLVGLEPHRIHTSGTSHAAAFSDRSAGPSLSSQGESRPFRTTSTWSVAIAVFVIVAAVITIGQVVVDHQHLSDRSATIPPSASPSGLGIEDYEISGEVSCSSGRRVVSVGVIGDEDSGSAALTTGGGRPSVVYSYAFPKAQSYSLHVSCGGSADELTYEADSPKVSGTNHSFKCLDVRYKTFYGHCFSSAER